jgi:hypothetical protein
MRKQIPISTRELPFKTYDVQDIDSISLVSGYLNLHIPIVSHPQRGAIPRAYQLGYNDKNWFVNERCTNNQTQPCALRWEYRGSGVRVINTGWAEYGYGPLFHKIASPTIFTAYTADGSSHWFDATRASGLQSVDGSQIWSSATQSANGGTIGGVVKTNNGSLYKHGDIPVCGRGRQRQQKNHEDDSTPHFVTSDTMGGTFPLTSTATSDFSGAPRPLRQFKSTTLLFPVCQDLTALPFR